MKKYFLFVIFLFLVACSNTSSSFVNISMPNFRPQVPIKIEPTDTEVTISLEPIIIEQNNNYSDYFENSVLKIRIEKEIELLKQNLEEQMITVAKLKGYKIVNSNSDYILKSLINVYIEERDVQKENSFMSGDFIKSNLGINFQGKISFIDAHNPQNSTNFSSNTKLDSLISLVYPIKNVDGVDMFKTTISTVPTQLNKGLERPAFEIDKSFLTFYKTTLNSLYSNLSKAIDMNKYTPKGSTEFNSFNENTSFEEAPPVKQNNTFENTPSKTENQNSNNQDRDGVIIFE
ncbi:hypothetical protein [Campylobacter estrildidarum]|uniref:Lipoprotein n=1 Tax=Campylobacter estrildidarum TaxID=2510189 RepID=A0A4U7BME2_9BACT|nr:hypothetical protein [Campylobacter estrildidarum]TKX31340.1 hypothetical protein CQA69_03595 [Campylobacter estrildidarum]